MDNYDAYLFDWDGTSARTLEVWLELVRDCFAEFGVTGLADSEIAGTFGSGDKAFIDLGIPEEKFPDFDELLKNKALAKIPAAPLYDGIREVWEDLKNQDKKLALITSNYKEVISGILNTHNVADLFDIAVAVDDVRAPKPSPEGIEFALSNLGVDKSRAVMLGDSRHDIGAANNAGIDSVLYYPASHALFHDFETLAKLKPTYTIGDWGELSDAN